MAKKIEQLKMGHFYRKFHCDSNTMKNNQFEVHVLVMPKSG